MGSLGFTKLSHQDTSSLVKQQSSNSNTHQQQQNDSARLCPNGTCPWKQQDSARATQVVLQSVSLCKDQQRMWTKRCKTVVLQRHKRQKALSHCLPFNPLQSPHKDVLQLTKTMHLAQGSFQLTNIMCPLMGGGGLFSTGGKHSHFLHLGPKQKTVFTWHSCL